MTYIIAEPCIDIKDRSCVDVCPVDCIHEAGRILVIDPEECIDCFAPEEMLITSYGVKTFAELEDQRYSVGLEPYTRPPYEAAVRGRALLALKRPRDAGEMRGQRFRRHAVPLWVLQAIDVHRQSGGGVRRRKPGHLPGAKLVEQLLATGFAAGDQKPAPRAGFHGARSYAAGVTRITGISRSVFRS